MRDGRLRSRRRLKPARRQSCDVTRRAKPSWRPPSTASPKPCFLPSLSLSDFRSAYATPRRWIGTRSTAMPSPRSARMHNRVPWMPGRTRSSACRFARAVSPSTPRAYLRRPSCDIAAARLRPRPWEHVHGLCRAGARHRTSVRADSARVALDERRTSPCLHGLPYSSRTDWGSGKFSPKSRTIHRRWSCIRSSCSAGGRSGAEAGRGGVRTGPDASAS